MKVMYIGDKGDFSRVMIRWLNKAEHDVFFLAQEDLPKERKERLKYHFFQLSDHIETIEEIFDSVRPEAVVFAGIAYMKDEWSLLQQSYLSCLAVILEECVKAKVERFVYLSSTQVYGEGESYITEKSKCFPQVIKGIWQMQGEDLLMLYHEQFGIKSAVLRCAPVFSDTCQEDGDDFLSRRMRRVKSGEDIQLERDSYCYTVYISDVADAVCRVLDTRETVVYNVAGQEPVKESRLYGLLCQMAGVTAEVSLHNEALLKMISSEKIRKDLEWTDFKNLERMLEDGSIAFEKKTVIKEEKKRKKKSMTEGVRKTLENIAVFFVFFAMSYICQSHSLFSKIDWLIIYVVTASLIWGVKQSALAVLLAGAAHLWIHGIGGSFVSFYSYAENILMVVEFMFLGITVGYGMDMLRENIREKEMDMELLHSEHLELKEINRENVVIKNEYEKRLLDSKKSLPRLYSILRNVNVLEPDKILMEILNVIAEMLGTNTVAVYTCNPGSPYLRLVTSLNEASVLSGNSWNLNDTPDIRDTVLDDRIYSGNVLRGEAAYAAPITCDGKCLAVVLVKEVPFESNNLYQKNLLRTLLLLITEAMAKAIEYENRVKAEWYVGNTTILNKEKFIHQLRLEQEKKENGFAEYQVLKIETGKQNIEAVYNQIASMFRSNDYLGTDGSGGLYVILGNADKDGSRFVIGRLKEKGITAASHEFQTLEGLDE